MTTAHKPTWHPAVGKSNEGGWDTAGAVSHQFSVRDMPQQLTLKKRKFGQGSQSELLGTSASDLRAKLEAKEQVYFAKKGKRSASSGAGAAAGIGAGAALALPSESSVSVTDSDLKAIEDKFDDSDEFESSSEDDSSDSEDDEAEQAALMAELERIKKEREEEARQREKERAESEKAERERAMNSGNPLLQKSASGVGGALKKRWNDDVVFKNQARDAPVVKKRYVNDTVRNDFHRKFMARYIK